MKQGFYSFKKRKRNENVTIHKCVGIVGLDIDRGLTQSELEYQLQEIRRMPHVGRVRPIGFGSGAPTAIFKATLKSAYYQLMVGATGHQHLFLEKEGNMPYVRFIHKKTQDITEEDIRDLGVLKAGQKLKHDSQFWPSGIYETERKECNLRPKNKYQIIGSFEEAIDFGRKMYLERLFGLGLRESGLKDVDLLDVPTHTTDKELKKSEGYSWRLS